MVNHCCLNKAKVYEALWKLFTWLVYTRILFPPGFVLIQHFRHQLLHMILMSLAILYQITCCACYLFHTENQCGKLQNCFLKPHIYIQSVWSSHISVGNKVLVEIPELQMLTFQLASEERSQGYFFFFLIPFMLKGLYCRGTELLQSNQDNNGRIFWPLFSSCENLM